MNTTKKSGPAGNGLYSRCSGKPKRKSRVILVLAVPMIVTPTRLRETAGRFLANGPSVLISGVLAMVAGLSIDNMHNVWIVDWTLIVTVFGWALVLGGASRIIAPQVVSDVGSSMMGRPTMTRVIGTFWALLGAFLTFKVYA